jgi:hypothetical protein
MSRKALFSASIIAQNLEKTGALFFAVLLLGRAIPAGQILAAFPV